MEELHRSPLIRIYTKTRKRLKILAAQHDMTMIDFVEWLTAEQEKREKEPVAEKS